MMSPGNRKSILVGFVLAAVFLFAVLSIPAPDPPLAEAVDGKPFTWKQDAQWNALEASFKEARGVGCIGLKDPIDKDFRQSQQYLASLAVSRFGPDAPIFTDLEKNIFSLGTMVGACPERIGEYIELVTKTRSLLKRQSENWDMNDRAVRDRLYRLIYGGRAALEEVMLQAPAGSCPDLILGEPVPSVTPLYTIHRLTLHSGDILVSRGGAPTSALIARGNDYPGNFSHVALFYVDEKTGEPGIIESHIEVGVVVSTVEAYIKDKKLRIMVLRLRPDLPQMKADPMLPHKAAKGAYEEAKSRHIPYDFEMDYKDPSKMFCSEVASAAYRPLGIELWKGTTHMSSPGVVKWLSYFGVTHFETQAPADLEYDPQLSVVAEWRDLETLWQDHVDNAVTEAMLEGADEGDVIPAPWWKVAPVRLAKGYSALLNYFGGVGPVPEGMDATAAVRNLELTSMHTEIKNKVLAQAAAFQEKQGYRPPYWELVRMANKARAEIREQLK
ncbi:MAG TPA: YiiX/YebB-like N1pC/P60 family cysteine hydrolase [Syntrophales bacterium]|nr:YiiX/YebB-like N1pC/P60 family cysteine hydrolase [Syntrophales bacterium]